MSTRGRDFTHCAAPPEMLLDFLSLHMPKTPSHPTSPRLGTPQTRPTCPPWFKGAHTQDEVMEQGFKPLLLMGGTGTSPPCASPLP